MTRKVLVIDDSPFVFKAVSKALEGTEWEVVGNALDGQIGVDKYIELRPDVITLDVTMPIMDGIEALEKIIDEDKDACVVMISALGQEFKIIEALRKGARHYIIKPFKEEDIICKIKGIIAESKVNSHA